jgi:uncharacterized membrane protein YebE (DUF533 family)
MLDAERMLGSLVRNALGGGGRRRRRRSMFGVNRGALGLGALGVAIAAYEHLTQAKPAASAGGAAPLPPLPVPLDETPDLPPLPVAGSGGSEALLMVRAMIAAANADYAVDETERDRILEALDGSGASDEERRFVLAELEAPLDLATLAGQVTSPDLARQVYAASRMAIDVDSPAERNYLARLAGRLGLTEDQVAALEAMVGAGPGEEARG